ncbi:MAG: hypothetical protein M3O28_00920 [Actinomycetota bacterium]|nr:hypothetical protein [Actinomycetota bacterium]
MNPAPLDEYPIHQSPLSMARVATSDRNFYDRCYFNAHDRTGDVFLVTGLGTYPNLGVVDAFATVRHADRQYTVRFSDALGERALDQVVGPYRVEVIEPLHRIRVVCDAAADGVGFDLRWEGSFPALMEQSHQLMTGNRVTLDASRFAQLGSWQGSLHVAGIDFDVEADTWLGSRDRSWGIRPVGEPAPPGRAGDEPQAGFWWLYAPVRFDDFALIVILQESPDGYRTLNDATRIFADGRVEQLGWPRVEIDYRSGSRHPEHARLHLTTPSGEPLVVEIDILTSMALHVGAGYGGDPDWTHGQWMGRAWSKADSFDLTDPAVSGRLGWGVSDHVARATCNASIGWGMFEHASLGRHDPTGFADWMSVAP